MNGYLVSFHTASASDDWLRSIINGAAPRSVSMTLNFAIVESGAEAYRIVHALAALKHERGLPYGGASYRRMA